MGANTSTTAREYLRVSKDKSGRMRSTAETHSDNIAHAEREGWTLGEPYAELKDVGASRYSKGTRAGFEALVADLESGRFGADILIMWSSSRGSRRLSEWARFLELLEENGVKLYITSHGRLYDLSNWRDMRTMQEDGSDNEAEIAKMRAGILRAVAEDAAQGRPYSSVNVGYRVVRDQRSGKRIGWEVDPEKAPLIEELFRRVRAGDSFRAIARDWAARGVTKARGGHYSPAHLRVLATKAAYTGLRVHKGTLTEAVWLPIVPRAQWWEVQRILSTGNRGNGSRRPGRGVHVYTMIIRCDLCGGPLVVQHMKRGKGKHGRSGRTSYYICRADRCVTIKKAPLDEILDEAVVGYLSSPDVYERLSATPDDAEQVAVLEARIAQTRHELDEARRQVPATVHQAETFGQLRENLTRRIEEDERTLREMTVPPEIAALLEPGEDVAVRWRDAPVAAKRRVAVRLLSPEFLGEVRVGKAGSWHPPAIDRITWRTD